ncbi:MAG: sugar ABC transporter substrate-binding protein [Anaerolineae bacterium]|nr:sugar ABC transporter substrate-binding protein [Anaerolineae bacterium]NUQ06173.1 sugar ABC transporter substrate-binding protein [Anaerolineae bacterium]
MNRKPFYLFLTVCLIVLSAVGASAQDEATNLRFTVWVGPGAAMDMLNGIATDYTAEHPNVSITFDTIPFGEYTSQLVLQLAGSNPPDGGWILETNAPQFVQSGVITDLTPTLSSYADYNYGDLIASALALWQDGEALYGLPFSTSPFLILYNVDAFEAAGLESPNALAAKGEWTWEALASAAKTIKESQGIYGFESNDGLVYTDNFWATMFPLMRAYGGGAWDAEGNCLLNSPGSVAGVQLYHDMVFGDRSAVPPGEAATFAGGQAAMRIGQISRVAQLDGASFAWDVAPMPTGPAGSSSVIGQAALAIFRNSPNQDVALDFLAFMTNEANSETMSQFFPPARGAVLGSDTFLNSNTRLTSEQMALVVDGIEMGAVLPSSPNFSQINLQARALFDELWVPDADVQATMNAVCETIAPLL